MLPKKTLMPEFILSEGIRKELTVGKIAEVCQLGFDEAQNILNQLIKQIVSCAIFLFVKLLLTLLNFTRLPK